jgi:gluconolactonase
MRPGTEAGSAAGGWGLERILESIAVERLASGFEFLEGPAWHASRKCLIFSDIIGDAMHVWRESGPVAVFRRPSHRANGNAWDREGRLLTCEHSTSRISRTDRNGRYQVIASHFKGCELNSPNDIVVRRDGSVYFTDPTPGRTARFGVEREQQLDFQGVFRLDPESGELTLLVEDFSKPNGLCFSRDESLLYVNDTDRQHIRVFEVRPDGSLGGGQVFATTGGTEPGVADGMKIDRDGNLYSCGSGGIHVFDAAGQRMGVIRLPEIPANFTWGGTDLTDFFVTARTSLYRLRARIPGHAAFDPAAGAAG